VGGPGSFIEASALLLTSPPGPGLSNYLQPQPFPSSPLCPGPNGLSPLPAYPILLPIILPRRGYLLWHALAALGRGDALISTKIVRLGDAPSTRCLLPL
jgi:hypothetical protein